MIAVNAKHHRRPTYRFIGNEGINAQNLSRGDIVVFSVNNEVVEDLFALRNVSNFPWSSILKQVGNYKDIEFDYFVDRERTILKHITIPVIENCINMLRQEDENNLWRSFLKRIKAYTDPELKDNYTTEVLTYGLRDFFIKKCVKREHALLLQEVQEKDYRLLSEYSYVINKVLNMALEEGELKEVVAILNCFNLRTAYGPFMKVFNSMDDDWERQKGIILSSVVPEGEKDCFSEMLSESIETMFSSRSLLTIAIVKDDDLYLESITNNFGEDVQSWLQTIPKGDFVRLSEYLDRFESSFVDDYIQVLRGMDEVIKFLLVNIDNRGETVIERILKKVQSSSGVPDIASLLIILPPSAIEFIFRSYNEYPDGNKKIIIDDFRHKRLNAEILLSPLEENKPSVATILSTDNVFTGLEERFNPDLISGTYWQYKQLHEKGLIPEITRQLIVKCLREEDDTTKAKAILDNLEDSLATSIMEEDMPDSSLVRDLLADRWVQASSLDYVSIDIESDRVSIRQAAAVHGNIVVLSPDQNNLNDVIYEILGARVIVGHNIKSFDLPILYEHGLLERQDQFIWDTYEIEMALEPTRFSYALDDPHEADKDAKLCEKLFWNQLYRICKSNGRYDHIKAILPDSIQELMVRISVPILHGFFEERAALDTQFFMEANSLDPTVDNIIKAITGNALIIAPEELWPEIATRINAIFPTARDFQYLKISKAAVYSIEDKTTIEAIVLRTFVDSQENPLIVKLSKAVRILIKDDELASYVEESNVTSGILCTDSFGVEQLGNLNELGITDIYAISCEIESRMNSIAIGDSFCAADLLKSDYGSRLVLKLSGASFTPISREDCQLLGLDDIPSGAKNIWMKKDDKDLYQVYCNRIFSDFIEDLQKQNPSVSLHTIDCNLPDTTDAKITIVSTKKHALFDARNKRVTPASLYRSMYWAYQFALLEGIETSLVKVLYITNSNEIPSITRYAESKGYYVPDVTISIQRRIELCKENGSTKTIIIIGPEGFRHLRQAKVKYPYCLIWDNLETDCLQVMWRGMLPFGDEPIYGAEVDNRIDNDQKKDIPPTLGCILGMWSIITYYYHQLFLQDADNEICLLDPSFDDYKELENSFLAKGQEVELWTSDSAYQEDLKAANQFFVGKRKEETLNDNIDEVMATIWQVFVVPKLKGTSDGWTDIQKEALPVIFKRETNTLVSIPTGGGKSVLFQGTALYRAAFTNRLSIVVTPLKALMQDQVESLHDLGFVTNVDYLNSDKTLPETNRIYRKIAGGEIALLYITPERFRSRGFWNALASRMQVDAGLEYIIFDEAHCISQWGLDFRPDYLSAARTCSKIAQEYTDTRIELFSATVTGQVQKDIEAIINPIRVISSEASYNPIRNHIGMQFEVVNDSIEERVKALYKHITNDGFDPHKSRILVFCRRKKDTEEGCELLKAKLVSDPTLSSISEKIGFFHAGMETDERAQSFAQYKNGEFIILFATKAFGMGMDIPNIHFVYHLNPPLFIEDYLQEVGRAGRSRDLYTLAGFNPDNPIPTFCFISVEDFRNMKTLLAQSMMSWMNVRAIYKSVTDFVRKFQPRNITKKVPVAVPDNIWKKDTANGLTTDPVAFRLGLYWLERMNRIDMGFYAPTTLDLSMPKTLKSPSAVPEERLRSIYEYILSAAGENCAGENIQIYINDICSALSIGQYSLFHYIIQGTKRGLFSVATKTSFDLTKIRSEEMKFCSENRRSYYVIDAIFEATKILLSSVKLREVTRIDIQKRNTILDTVLASIRISGDYMPWHNPHSVGLSKRTSYIQDISFKRAKIIFDIVDMLPGVSIKSLFDTGNKQVVQEVFLSSNKWTKALDELKENCLRLLNALITARNGNHKDFVWANVIKNHNLPESYQYFGNMISILRSLGFIKVESILSTGLEISLTDNDNEVPASPKNGLDGEIYNDFTRVNHLKDIKFALMNAFSKVKKTEYDFFIKEYFKCELEKDYLDLLNLVVNENDPILSELQAGAIKAQESRLDEQQRAIYDAPIDRDINVLAGPGSGKTHVLTLRCARLVYHEKVMPQNILVLAYNRAVVEELKTRLAKLFGELGFGRAMSRLQIYTFDGFAKRYCRDIQDRPVEEWEEAFLNYVRTNPGEFLSEMGNVQYILIDEFQDITQVRLDLMLELRRILTTEVSVPRFFTIGDINQSIYGFDKLKQGQPMDPLYYYNQLYEAINPDTMKMFINYRSYQGILDEAFKFVPNSSPDLRPISAPSIDPPESQYVFVKDIVKRNGQQIGLTWHEEFPTLFEKIVKDNASLDDSERKKREIKTIAIFFRNNNEVYRGYGRIRKMGLPGTQIRVQGSSSEFFRTRECYALIRSLRKEADKVIPSNMKGIIKAYIDKNKNIFPKWDMYYLDLTYALVLEFLDSTSGEIQLYSDLADYLEDIGKLDDGLLSKVYQKHINSTNEDVGKINIILTTMHKVKGLEFDAVVVTPSDQSVGYKPNGTLEQNYADMLEEEKRLYFVAYTRAKKLLYSYQSPREMAMAQGRPYMPCDNLRQCNVISFREGIKKLYINYTARFYNASIVLATQLQKDDPIVLRRNSNGYDWDLCFVGQNGHYIQVGQLAKGERNMLNRRATDLNTIHGLFVNDIFVWRYEDSLRSDAYRGSSYAETWSDDARKAGYILVVDFAGYIEF